MRRALDITACLLCLLVLMTEVFRAAPSLIVVMFCLIGAFGSGLDMADHRR